MKQAEPPSTVPCARSLHFLIGKDSRGNWVVQDDRGLCGGLFVNRRKLSSSQCLRMEIIHKLSSWFLVSSSSM